MQKAKKIVIDLRQNSGGDYKEALKYLIEPIFGQPIGERPNSYQEANEVRLPNSHLLLRYSTQYCEFLPGARENRIIPDKAIFPTWGDVKDGRDPVLPWALSVPACCFRAALSRWLF